MGPGLGPRESQSASEVNTGEDKKGQEVESRGVEVCIRARYSRFLSVCRKHGIITHEELLYSKGNSVQCYVAAWMGGKFAEMDTCVCVAESLCCPPGTITTLLISYTPIQNKKCFF